MTDTHIAKSATYTIGGGVFEMAIDKPKLRLRPGVNQLDFFLCVIPNDISPDQILKLADVARFGGKILYGQAEAFTITPDELLKQTQPNQNSAPKAQSGSPI